MKTTCRILALVLVLAMMACTLISCAPAADPDKAAEALKKKEYAVLGDVESSVFVGTLNTVLSIAKVDVKVSDIVRASKYADDQYYTITVVYFEDADSANTAWDEMKDYAEKDKDENEDSEWIVEKSGKMIYWGTKNAMGDAR